jgi:hypothetical protein
MVVLQSWTFPGQNAMGRSPGEATPLVLVPVPGSSGRREPVLPGGAAAYAVERAAPSAGAHPDAPAPPSDAR